MAQASAEKLLQTGPAKKKRISVVPQNEQLARTTETLCQKGKELRNQFRSLDFEMGVDQNEQMQHLGKKGRLKGEHGKQRVDYTEKEGGFQKKILAFSGDTGLEMEKVRSKRIPRKFWGCIEAEQGIIH